MSTQLNEQRAESTAGVLPTSVEFGAGNSLLERLYRAFGPIVGGLILDYTDLVTFGPAGPVVGFAVGYWVSRMYGFSSTGRVIFAILSGIYCGIPFTNLIPLATIISCAARFFHERPENEPGRRIRQ